MTARYQAEIEAKHIRALSHLASVRDVRYYLKGVQVTATPDVTLAASDGTRIGVIRTGQVASTQFEVRIPNDTIKQLGKFAGVAILSSENGWDWSVKAGALQLNWRAENETYPQLRRAIPAQVSGEAALFDIALLSTFLGVAKDLGLKVDARTVLFSQNGGGTALVSLPDCPEFIGAFAVLRNDPTKWPAPLQSPPGWATREIQVPADWRASDETCDLA